ncbi:MAG: glycosyltransferase family 2 protein [Aquificota bacterium]|nr:MAG: glycosyltransferase family 2 protein [Aquificota bacterium]
MGKPKVSVILPTFNRAKYLDRAISSVLSQSFYDFELIIVDDASTDNTEEIVGMFKDERIIYVKNPKNLGGAGARNIGIKMAKGDFIAFQDSDDLWHPDKLELQMKVFEKAEEDVAVVYTAFIRKVGEKELIVPPPYVKKTEGYIYKELLTHINFVGTPTAVIRKEALEDVGYFDERFPRLQDWDLFLRLAKKYRFKFIKKPLLTAYDVPGNISSNPEALIKALKLLLGKHYTEIRKDRKIVSKFYQRIGEALLSAGRVSEGRTFLFKAFIAYPLNPKLAIKTSAALFGKKL